MSTVGTVGTVNTASTPKTLRRKLAVGYTARGYRLKDSPTFWDIKIYDPNGRRIVHVHMAKPDNDDLATMIAMARQQDAR